MLEGILGGVAFVGLFTAWVVIPSYVKRRHDRKGQNDDLE